MDSQSMKYVSQAMKYVSQVIAGSLSQREVNSLSLKSYCLNFVEMMWKDVQVKVGHWNTSDEIGKCSRTCWESNTCTLQDAHLMIA